MTRLATGDEVAILPYADSPPRDVLEIGTIGYAATIYVQLTDGRLFAVIGGKSLRQERTTYIVPATEAHHAALQMKIGHSAEEARRAIHARASLAVA